jgi:hypothetical protein
VLVVVVQLDQVLCEIRERARRQDVQQLAQITLSVDEVDTPKQQHNDATNKAANQNLHGNRPDNRQPPIDDTPALRLQPE